MTGARDDESPRAARSAMEHTLALKNGDRLPDIWAGYAKRCSELGMRWGDPALAYMITNRNQYGRLRSGQKVGGLCFPLEHDKAIMEEVAEPVNKFIA
jgi:hypothetical protein